MDYPYNLYLASTPFIMYYLNWIFGFYFLPLVEGAKTFVLRIRLK
nr:MAG TPA: hypothetical protein [Caudoviricetes sp.]